MKEGDGNLDVGDDDDGRCSKLDTAESRSLPLRGCQRGLFGRC